MNKPKPVYLRKAISLTLTLLIALPSAFGQESVTSKITAMPTGTKIELHLSNKQVIRGARGQLSNAGFTFVDARNGERQIAFDDVVSVKQLKSHTIRNILIVAGIGVAALAITMGILLRCGPFGCGKPVL